MSASKYWSSYAFVTGAPDSDYYFTIGDALYVGNEDGGEEYWSLYNAMDALYPDNKVYFYSTAFDTYLQKAKGQILEPVISSIPIESVPSVLLNNSMATNTSFVSYTVDELSIFGCILHPLQPCMAYIEFCQTFPRNDDDVADTSIPR